MKSIRKHKWIVVPIAVAIILTAGAVGAVALADPGGGDRSTAATQAVTATTGVQSTAATTARTASQPGQALRQAIKARLQHRLELLKQRWTQVRAKMNPTDQAAFDQLVQTAEDQLAALQKDRQDLLATLKQILALIQNRPLSATPTTAAPSGQVQ